MTIKSEPYYWVECDKCGCPHDAEFSAWQRSVDALDYAVRDGWTIGGWDDAPEGAGHLCPTCAVTVICPKCDQYLPEGAVCTSEDCTDRQEAS